MIIANRIETKIFDAGLEPGFVSPLENMTIAAGRSAHFTCVVNNLGGHKVTLN